ncbi:MAG: methyltransferase domain-containing protein [Candidatus Lokiarchaeota archaeon]|nr:methyltransferase domain-containing protein [Candidatus Lokiarchaeota archaeon]
MEQERIKENSLIFLVLDSKRRWLVQVQKNEEFQTHKGIVDLNELIGKPFGSVVFSKPYDKQGYKFIALKPYPSDYVLYMSRRTQIIYPEDAGLILMYSGICPGSIVLEAGCGSGALTCILASYIRPYGRVYSFDMNIHSVNKARKNISNLGLEEFVSIQKANILEDRLPIKEVDSIVLDMPQPWEAIGPIEGYLKLGGSIVSFSPTIEQVKKTFFALKKNNFFEINSYELLKRELQVKANATRPQTRMVGHTGYITFGRKIENIENPYIGKKPEKEEFVSFEGMPLR